MNKSNEKNDNNNIIDSKSEADIDKKRKNPKKRLLNKVIMKKK